MNKQKEGEKIREQGMCADDSVLFTILELWGKKKKRESENFEKNLAKGS